MRIWAQKIGFDTAEKEPSKVRGFPIEVLGESFLFGGSSWPSWSLRTCLRAAGVRSGRWTTGKDWIELDSFDRLKNHIGSGNLTEILRCLEELSAILSKFEHF
jgi:hypothetical protein